MWPGQIVSGAIGLSWFRSWAGQGVMFREVSTSAPVCRAGVAARERRALGGAWLVRDRPTHKSAPSAGGRRRKGA